MSPGESVSGPAEGSPLGHGIRRLPHAGGGRQLHPHRGDRGRGGEQRQPHPQPRHSHISQG